MNIHRLPRRWPAGRQVFLMAAAMLVLGGCAVGPDFKTPAAPVAADTARPYTQAPMPAETASAPGRAGAAQRFVNAQDIPAMWWSLFRSEPLDQLVRASLTQSPTLAAAQAALRQAQENYAADAGTRLLPAINGQLGAERERASQVTTGIPGGGIYNLYNATVGVSYTVDAFGGIRRELEGLQAVTDYQRLQVEATYLTLTANVVTTAIQEASLRAQLQATRDVVDAEQKALALVQTQARLGAIAKSSVLAQQAQLRRRWRPSRPTKSRLRRRASSSPSTPAVCRATRPCRPSVSTR